MPRHSLRTLLLYLAAAAPACADEAPPRATPLEWLQQAPERFLRRVKPVEETVDSPAEIEEMQKRVRAKTFDGIEEKRDEEVDISRPLKQAGLAVGDGQLEIVRTFLAFQAAEGIRKAMGKLDVTRVTGETLKRLGASRANQLAAGLAKSSWGTKLAQNLGASTFKGLMARESNFALIALINTLLIWGFYDGMDLDSFKDQVDAAAALMHDHTPGRYIPGMIAEGFLSRAMYDVFEKRWNVLYEQAVKHQSTAGRLLRNLDEAVAATGQRLLKSNRTGAGQAAVAAVNPEESLAKKMGLVGVGEGTALTLSGLAGRFFVGAGMATVGSLGIETLTTFVTGVSNRTTVGGNRNRYYGRADVNSFQLQKTGHKLKDWWHERALAVRALWDNKIKWPVRTVVGPTAALVGAYLGSVAAGALIAGTGVPAIVGGTLISTLFGGLGEFVGSWVATKVDRSKSMMAFRRRGYESMVRREIEGMPAYREGRISEDEVDRLARERALDFERMETTGFDPPQFFFIDSIENVRLFEKGGYLNMAIADANGRELNTVANIRHLVLDMEGRRAQFDLKQKQMVYVGKEADNNGRDIVFVDQAHVKIEDDVLVNQEDQGVYVFSNGNILEKKTPEELQLTPDQRGKKREEEWVIRGHAASRDLFVRETGQRLAFQDGTYRVVDVVGAPEKEGATAQDADPLAVYFPVMEGDSGEAAMREALVRQSQVALQRTSGRLDQLFAAAREPAKLEQVLVEAGALDPDGPAAAALREVMTREDGAEMVKTRVGRFIERLGISVGQALPAAPIETLRADIEALTAAKASTSGPAATYAEGHERLQRSTVWGSLSLLGRPECLLVAAFDPSLEL